MEQIAEKNTHLNIISECGKRVDNIRIKTSIILSTSCEKLSGEECASTTNSTELERELNGLLIKLKELENDIIV
jgi:hypothetical protein